MNGQCSDWRVAIDDLQSRLAFQEDTLQQLDTVIIRQGHLIEALERRIVGLEARLEALQFAARERTTPEDERPPHY